MIKIDLLKNHPHAIPTLANIWHEVLGKIWMPEISIEEIEALTYEELKSDMAITYIALYDKTPVGFCTLQLNEDIRPDLGPWIADLVVDPQHQKQGIGKMLISTTIRAAKELDFEKLYLFTFDPAIPGYYNLHGFKTIGTDEFKGYPVTVMETKL